MTTQSELRIIRQARGLSRQAVADLTGIPRARLAEIETRPHIAATVSELETLDALYCSLASPPLSAADAAGQWLKLKRVEAGLSRRQAARLCGLSEAMIWRTEVCPGIYAANIGGAFLFQGILNRYALHHKTMLDKREDT